MTSLQAEELKLVPAESEKAISHHQEKLEKLEVKKKEEEGKMATVMEGLKTETKVDLSNKTETKVDLSNKTN